MRQDRQGRGGGGILLYAKDNICGQIVPGSSVIDDGVFNQFVSCKVIGKSSELNLYVIYRPPSSCDPDYVNNNMKLCNLVRSIPENSILCGDFNYSKINWKSMTSDTFSQQFLDTCNDKFLSQHIDFPTHRSGNTLDLLLSTDEELIGDVTDCGPLGGADHTKILAEVILPRKNNDSAESIRL